MASKRDFLLAEQIAKEVGFVVSGRHAGGRHIILHLRLPDGRERQMPCMSNFADPRDRRNYRAQLRRLWKEMTA